MKRERLLRVGSGRNHGTATGQKRSFSSYSFFTGYSITTEEKIIEVKTISPEKAGSVVHVKRSGNFNKLLVIKIDQKFNFEGRFVERRKLAKGSGTHASISWSTLGSETEAT